MFIEQNEISRGFEPRIGLSVLAKSFLDLDLLAFEFLPLPHKLLVGHQIADAELGEVIEGSPDGNPRPFERVALRLLCGLLAIEGSLKFG